MVATVGGIGFECGIFAAKQGEKELAGAYRFGVW